MKLIEHDPNANKRKPSVWAPVFTILAALWGASLFYFSLDWHSVLLGLGTGAVIAGWAVEMTGNKVPPWMSGLPTRRNRNP